MDSTEDIASLPRHIAIIMDGNGRWAKARGLPRSEGHRAGARRVRDIVAECVRLGVPFLTLYAFSSENWNRPPSEIAALFSLLLEFLYKETPDLVAKGVSLNVIGDINGLPAPQRAALKLAMEKTSKGKSTRLSLALNYGARAEIVRAARLLAEECVTGAELGDIFTEAAFAAKLYTAEMPDPDLLIRASGEERLSNFLLWQCAYTELYFTRTLWPDFDESELRAAIAAYAKRERRFGRADS